MPRQRKQQEIVWAYGVTTVPSRLETTFGLTAESLGKAGFPEPWVFLDGAVGSPLGGYERLVYRDPAILPVGNWILALWELLLRNTRANRFAIFQDDILLCRNVRQYLEQCEYQEKSYYNLCTYPQNDDVRPTPEYKGWYKSNQRARGAQALMFDRQAVFDLLTHRNLVRQVNRGGNWFKGIDGMISRCLLEDAAMSYTELVHSPSLVDHMVSEPSSIKAISTTHGKQPAIQSFAGVDFDAMELLNETG